MNYGKLFTGAILALSICAAIGFLASGDYRKAIYWASASAIAATFIW